MADRVVVAGRPRPMRPIVWHSLVVMSEAVACFARGEHNEGAAYLAASGALSAAAVRPPRSRVVVVRRRA